MSLNALLCVEASARHQSFKKAADELGITAFAVSHQVRRLEQQLGHRLFLRSWRSVELTELGKRVLPMLQDGFGNIFAAMLVLQDVRHEHDQHRRCG